MKTAGRNSDFKRLTLTTNPNWNVTNRVGHLVVWWMLIYHRDINLDEISHLPYQFLKIYFNTDDSGYMGFLDRSEIAGHGK